LAYLQERVRVAEQRLTAIAEETIQAKVGVVDERALNAALSLFTPVWETLSPREQSRIIRLLVERVDYDGKKGTLAVTFRPSGIQSLAQREVAA
ncbi:MAG TPA: hypothetical protein VK968_15415, partial [Roseimicrobium sp.]|nr:hypothetical protein [Roseimicrobium sp.]